MPAAGRRKKLADVTPESYDGWASFVALHGTNVTAFCECLGLYFAELGDHPPSAQVERILERARQLTQDRIRRPQA